MHSGTVILCAYYLLALVVDLLVRDVRLRPILAVLAAMLTLLVLLRVLPGRQEYTRLESAAAVLLLPLCGFVGAHMVCGALTDTLRVGLPFLAAFVLSLPLFMRAEAPGCLSRFAAALFGMLMALFLLFAILMNASGFAPVSGTFSVLSPNGEKVASALVVDEGALGGSVTLRVCPRTRCGLFSDGGRVIAKCGWLPPEEISLRWIDDSTLEFERKLYTVE